MITLASLAGVATGASALITRFWLPLALVASLIGNTWLLSRLGAANARADAEIAAAVERGRADAAELQASQQKTLASKADKDRAALVQELEAIAAASARERVVYVDRIKTLPAPECAPGQERMDAVNALIRGESE